MSISDEQMQRVQQLIAAESLDLPITAGSAAWLKCLCRAVVRALPATGAALSVMDSQGTQALVAASDQRGEAIEELQFALGEGPCRDALLTGKPVLAPDLGGQAATRWPVYAPAARRNGIHAVFAFPMTTAASHLGVLDVYRSWPGRLAADAVHLGLAFADVAMTGLLDAAHDEVTALPAGEAGSGSLHRIEVYHAQGMVQVDLNVSAEEALLRLRAHAFVEGRSLSDVARDVIDGNLILERDAP